MPILIETNPVSPNLLSRRLKRGRPKDPRDPRNGMCQNRETLQIGGSKQIQKWDAQKHRAMHWLLVKGDGPLTGGGAKKLEKSEVQQLRLLGLSPNGGIPKIVTVYMWLL